MPGTEAGLRSAYAWSFLAKGSCAVLAAPTPQHTHLITWRPCPPGPGSCPQPL